MALCVRISAYPDAAAQPGNRQPDGDTLYCAVASFCTGYPAWQRRNAGDADGVNRLRRALWRTAPCSSQERTRPGQFDRRWRNFHGHKLDRIVAVAVAMAFGTHSGMLRFL